MMKLKKEYADAMQLASLQQQKIAEHPIVGFGTDNRQIFYNLVKQMYSILIKIERLSYEKEFIKLVLA
jgi:hypothetical protein